MASWFWTVLGLGTLVALHEFGHLLAALAFGMRVERYALGFGPTLLTFRFKEIEWVLGLLPFGGYVQVAGMAEGDGTDAADPRSYANKPAWQRSAVVAAGPITNYGIAFVLLAWLFATGMPRATTLPTLGSVIPGAAADAAGLQPGDVLLEVGGKPVRDFRELREQLKASGGAAIPVVVQRGAERREASVTPRPSGKSFVIGVTPKTELFTVPWSEAPALAAKEAVDATVAIVMGLVGAIRGEGGMEFGGTLAAMSETAEAARLGAAVFLRTLAGISTFLGLSNLLPIPALDGGRLVFLAIEMVRRKPLAPRWESTVHGVGFLALLAAMVLLTFSDVQRLRERSAALSGPTSEAVDSGTP